VVWNLLTNAVKFTDRGGRIQVALERANSQAQITLSDSGRGIDPEFLPHLFERFRQADSSDTRRHGGMGLGLSIVRNLVEMHGGTVEARSPGLGRGSTFIVRLPLRAIRVDPRTVQVVEGDRRTRSPALAKLEGAKVLVVDDEPGAREVIAAVLTQYGATTTTVASAAEAMVALQQLRPDVLVSDISMPVQNGYELLATVRKMRPEEGGTVPAVALTAHARTEDRLRALASGFQAHVPKPVEPSELALVVANLVDRAKVA
jgi:CheY-like chemotaxis protein